MLDIADFLVSHTLGTAKPVLAVLAKAHLTDVQSVGLLPEESRGVERFFSLVLSRE